MWRDPFAVFCGALQNVWARLVLFAASIFLGGMIGEILGGADFGSFAEGTAFCVSPLVSMAALVVLILTESVRTACLVLAANCAAWCAMVAIAARAMGQA